MLATLRLYLRLGCVVVAATICHSAHAQIQAGAYTIHLQPVASGLVAPVQVTHPPGDSSRLFVVDQAGQVRIVQNGTLLPAPFLDITARMVIVNPGYDERGLLGIAFHPDYEHNGRFFVRYSKPRVGAAGEPCAGTSRECHEEILSEFHVATGNPNTADPASETILFRVDKPQFNHNGGAIAFGPDGFLYFTLGDGGGANDGLADNPPSHGSTGNAQNLGVPLGKVLRIDVSTPGTYSSPPSNPFVGIAGARPEIYAYGFRNPYNFSFDDGTGGDGRLIVADVGQNLFEEVDVVQRGLNYGWPIREGLHCFDPFAPNTVPATMCNTVGLVDPVAEYPHSAGPDPFGIAVVGGFVYRGAELPGLNGLYVFGDFSTGFGAPDGHLFLTDLSLPAPAAVQRLKLEGNDAPFNLYLKGFGRDPAGELYVAASTALGPTGTAGVILKIARCPADFNGSATISVQDIFDFLSAYFTADPRADVNGIGGVSVQDIFDFLAAYFHGC